MMPQVEGRVRPVWYYVPAASATFLTCAAIVAIHRDSFRTLVSAHGLLHTAIADRFLPGWTSWGRPENPFFAGELLPYYWFYHYIAARLGSALGVHPLVAFEWLALLAACLVWIAGVEIGRRLGWGPGPSLAIGFFALGGANAFGSVILLGKLAWGRRWPLEDGEYLWGLTHPILATARLNDPSAMYGPLINFFLNNSSRALALGLVFVSLLALLGYLQSGRTSGLGALILASAFCTAFSPIIGLVAALALSGALACEWLWIKLRVVALEEQAQIRFIRAATALTVGCVLPVSTYYHLFALTANPEIVLAPRFDLISTLAASAGPLFVLVCVALAFLPSQRRFLRIVTQAAVILILGNTMLRIPGTNESNLFHAAMFMLAVPAAGVIRVLSTWSSPRKWLVRLAVLALCASTPLIVLWAYWHRPPVPLSLDGVKLHRAPSDSPRGRLYKWVVSATTPDAVFITDVRPPLDTPVGNTPEFPALTGRMLFVAKGPNYVVNPYHAASRRRLIAATLADAHVLEPADRAYLAGLGRPAFLLIETANDELVSELRSLYGEPAFYDNGIVVFQLLGHGPR
jgi:hypothetical protein